MNETFPPASGANINKAGTNEPVVSEGKPPVVQGDSSRDERMGLPSASSADRLAHCPGSWAAEKGLPDLPTEAVTQSGTNIHAALESGSDDGLDMTEKEIAERLREMESAALAQWRSDIEEVRI